MIKLNKVQSRKLQFIKSATSKDNSRPALQTVNVNGQVAGCDGFRLHIVESISPEFDHLQGMVETGKVRAGENILDTSMYEYATYPEYKQGCPTGDSGNIIAMDPAFLLDICKYADKGSTLYIRQSQPSMPIVIKGTIQDDDFYAVVMPKLANKDGFDNKFQPVEYDKPQE